MESLEGGTHLPSDLASIKCEYEREVAQSCPTLCDPMDCSLPGSSVHGIFQARVLETGDQSLGREDPLEKETITHFSLLAWNIPWTEKPGGLSFMGSEKI